jgi:hypothetical protein
MENASAWISCPALMGVKPDVFEDLEAFIVIRCGFSLQRRMALEGELLMAVCDRQQWLIRDRMHTAITNQIRE